MIILLHIMMPKHIMLIMESRKKTDTAAAMPVITALSDVNAELCAENVEGALLFASLEKQVLPNERVSNISATSNQICD